MLWDLGKTQRRTARPPLSRLAASETRLRQNNYGVPYGPLAGGVRRLIDEFLTNSHRCRATAVEVDGLYYAQRLHDERAFLETRPDAVAGLSAAYRDEEQVSLGRRACQGGMIPTAAEMGLTAVEGTAPIGD